MKILKYKPELFYILLTVALTECLSVQASVALDDAALKTYKPSTLYKPTNLSALTWLKDLENQRDKLTNMKAYYNTYNHLKPISIEISATISGKYGIANRQATDAEAQTILSSIFKTRDYYAAYQANRFNDFYFSYNRKEIEKKLGLDEIFSHHLAFVFAVDYTRSSVKKENQWANGNKNFFYQASFSYHDQSYPIQGTLSRFYGNPFSYLFSHKSFTEDEIQAFSDFMKKVYLFKDNLPFSSKGILQIRKILREKFNTTDWKKLLLLISKIEADIPQPFAPQTVTVKCSKSLKASELSILQGQLKEEGEAFENKVLALESKGDTSKDNLSRYIKSLKDFIENFNVTNPTPDTIIYKSYVPGGYNSSGEPPRNILCNELITEAENLINKFHLFSLEKMGFEANYDQLNTILNKSKWLRYPGFKNTTLSGIKLSDNMLLPLQSITKPSIGLDVTRSTETKPSKESLAKASASEKPETNKQVSRLKLYQDQQTIKNITDTLNYLANLYKTKILDLETAHKVPKEFLTPYIASFEEYVKMTMDENEDFKNLSISYPDDFDPAIGPGKLLMMNPGTSRIKPLSPALEKAYQELEKEGEDLAMNYRLLAIQKKGAVTDLEILDQIEKTRKLTNYPGMIVIKK